MYDYYHPTVEGHRAIANYLVEKMFGGTSSGGTGGGTGGGSGATITPSSATIAVGATQTFTLSGTSATIQTVYMASGKCTIYNQSSTSVTVQAQGEGQDYLNVVLTDGTSLSVPITVGSSGGSGGSGGSGTVSVTRGNIE